MNWLKVNEKNVIQKQQQQQQRTPKKNWINVAHERQKKNEQQTTLLANGLAGCQQWLYYYLSRWNQCVVFSARFTVMVRGMSLKINVK